MCVCVLNRTWNSCSGELPCALSFYTIVQERKKKMGLPSADQITPSSHVPWRIGDPLTALPCIDHRTSNRTKKPNHWSWETPVRYQGGFHKATPLGWCRSPRKCFQKSKENKLSTWYNSGAIYYPKRNTGLGKVRSVLTFELPTWTGPRRIFLFHVEALLSDLCCKFRASVCCVMLEASWPLSFLLTTANSSMH